MREMRFLMDSFAQQQQQFMSGMSGLFTNLMTNMNQGASNQNPQPDPSARWNGFSNYGIPDYD